MAEDNEGFIEDDSIVLEDSDNSDVEDVDTSKDYSIYYGKI